MSESSKARIKAKFPAWTGFVRTLKNGVWGWRKAKP